jgi:hypothetical protein
MPWYAGIVSIAVGVGLGLVVTVVVVWLGDRGRR